MTAETVWRSSSVFPGTRSLTRWWRNHHGTELPARGFVWIVHGIGEHSGRYQEVASFLNQFGFDCLAIDLPGHGLSAREGGQRRLASFAEMLAEQQAAWIHWVEEGPQAVKGLRHTPWYLLGHSMGALLALDWILAGKAKADAPEFARRAYISAPPLKVKMPVPAWKEQASKFLGKLAPDIKLDTGLDPEALSYDAANVAAYREDPLVHGKASPRLYNSMTEAAERVRLRPQDIEIPVCLTIGADDPVVDGEALREYFNQLGTHKKFLQLPHCKHESLNEVNRETQAYAALAAWFV